jgi:hypothetical protein
MITITLVETRPNLNVDFHRVSGGHIDYIQKYNDIRHREVYGWTLSNDLLSRTFVVSYTSQEDQDIFLNDPIVMEMLSAQNTYNTNNNITTSKSVS